MEQEAIICFVFLLLLLALVRRALVLYNLSTVAFDDISVFSVAAGYALWSKREHPDVHGLFPRPRVAGYPFTVQVGENRSLQRVSHLISGPNHAE